MIYENMYTRKYFFIFTLSCLVLTVSYILVGLFLPQSIGIIGGPDGPTQVMVTNGISLVPPGSQNGSGLPYIIPLESFLALIMVGAAFLYSLVLYIVDRNRVGKVDVRFILVITAVSMIPLFMRNIPFFVLLMLFNVAAILLPKLKLLQVETGEAQKPMEADEEK